MTAKKQTTDDQVETLTELTIPPVEDAEASSDEELQADESIQDSQELVSTPEEVPSENEVVSDTPGETPAEENSDETGQQVYDDAELPVGFSVERALKLLDSIENDARTLRSMIAGAGGVFTSGSSPIPGFMTPAAHTHVSQYYAEDEGIEGTFDGERMVDTNGKSYQVPPNYASKSKLIEGDPLKLYIGADGKYVYKQLGPVERRNVEGTLRMEGTHYVVDSDEGHTYSILTACVTYYMALYSLKPGDRVTIMIPATGMARWAVIDNPA